MSESDVKQSDVEQVVAQPKLLPAGETTSAAEEIRQARLGLCAGLLNSTLAAAHLPAALAKRLREQFNGRVFESAELQTAIEDGRKLVSELTGGQVVQGPGRLHGMFDSETGCRRRSMTCWAQSATPAWRTCRPPGFPASASCI